MPELIVDKALSNGIKTAANAVKNLPVCETMTNYKTDTYGAVIYSWGLSALPSALLTAMSGASITFTYPYVQFFNFTTGLFLFTQTGVWSVDRSTYALTAVIPVAVADLTTTPSIPSGGIWQGAQFGNTLLFTNGSCAIIRYKRNSTTVTAIDTTFIPDALCNWRGRLFMGGFRTGAIKTALQYLFNYYSGTLNLTPAAFDSETVMWMSVSGEDMLMHFIPDLFLSGPLHSSLATELVLQGDFSSGTAWTAGGSWTLTGGKMVHTAGDIGTLSQTITNAIPYDLYRITFTLSSVTAGGVTLSLGGTPYTQASTNGTFTAYVRCGATKSLVFTPSLTFAGAIDNISVNAMDAWPVISLATGQQGQRHVPRTGDVLQLLPLDDRIMCYAKGCIGAFTPFTQAETGAPTFGFETYLTKGVAGRSSAGGSLGVHFVVDRESVGWLITSKGAERVGAEEFFSTLTATSLTVHWHEDRSEFWISGLAGSTPVTYTYNTKTGGMSKINAAACALFHLDGLTRLAKQDGDLSVATIETVNLDFGSRGDATVSLVEIDANHAAGAVTLRTRSGRSDTFSDKTVSLSRTGKHGITGSGAEVRLKFTNTSMGSADRVGYAKLTYSETGKRSLSTRVGA